MLRSYRPLIWLWAAILSLSAIGAATLQVLGPLPASPPPAFSAAATMVRSAPATPALSPVPVVPELAPPLLAASMPPSSKLRKLRIAARRSRAPGYGNAGGERLMAERDDYDPLPPAPPIRADQRVAHYIGLYSTGIDGVRTFRSAP